MYVYFIESNEIMSYAIRALLEQSQRLRYAGHAQNIETALSDLQALVPDVVLVRIESDASAGQIVSQLYQASPKSAIVMKISEDALHLVPNGIRAGATAVALHTTSIMALESCLLSAGHGGLWIDGSIWKRVYSPVFRESQTAADCAQRYFLTQREKQILQLIANGATNREVSIALGIGRETVKTHVRNLMQKLNVRRRVEVAVKAVEMQAAL